MVEYSRKVLDGSVGYTAIIDPKFKIQRIQVTFLVDANEQQASDNAMAAGIMGSSNAKYKNISEITAKLNSLYGANINVDVSRVGDVQKLSIGVSNICSEYALEGEDINLEVASILLDCIFSPNVTMDQESGETVFAKEPFDFRKKDLLDTIEAEINNKRGYAVMQAQRIAYRGENAGFSPYGTKETAEKVTPASAYKAYRELLKTGEAEVYYVGPTKNEKVEEIIGKAFGSIDRQQTKKVRIMNPAKIKDEPQQAEEKLDVSQCKMVLAFKSESDDFDSLRFFNTIFGGTPTSKLFTNVREKLSLCYYCASRFMRYKKTLFVDCGIEEENIQKTKDAILTQLEEIKNGNFSDDDMNFGLLAMLNSLKGVGDTASSYVNWYFSCFANGKYITPKEDMEALSGVSRERIIKAAKSLVLDTVYIMKG